MTHLSTTYPTRAGVKRAWTRPFVVLLTLLEFAVAGAGASDAQLDAELINNLPNEKRVEELLKQGANPNVGMKRAASRSSIKVLRLLIAHGADVNARNGSTSVLREAAGRQKPTAARILLEAGAKPDAGAVAHAAMFGRIETVKLLLAAGASPGDGLFGAALGGHIDTVKLLLERGAKVNARFEGGYTALHTAAQSGHVEVARLLLAAGADLDAGTSEGDTPLHRAVSGANGNLTVRLLVRAGARVNLMNYKGLTHIRLAEMYRQMAAHDWLVAVNGGSAPRGGNDPARPLHLSKEPVGKLLNALESAPEKERLAVHGELIFRGESVMPDVIKALESGAPVERFRRLLTLMGSEAESALPVLASRLEKKDEVNLVISLMDSTKPKAFDGLSSNAKASAAKALFEVVADPDSGDRGQRSAELLWRTGAHAAPLFLQLLRHESPTVRIRAGMALASVRLCDKRVEEELVKLTGADQPRAVQAAASFGLAGFREKAAVLSLLKKGPPPKQGNELDAVRQQAWSEQAHREAEKLGKFGPDVIDELLPFLSPLELPARLPAVTALASIGAPAVPRLVAMLNNPDRSVGLSASMALDRLGSWSVPDLIRALDTENEQVADLSIRALWWIGLYAKPALPELLEVVGDGRRSERTRLAAARAALKIDAPTGRKSEAMLSAIPLLIKALEKDNFEHQLWAAEALEAIGPAARDALPALRTRTKTPPPGVDTRGYSSDSLPRTATSAIAKIEAIPDPESEDDF